MSPKMKLHLKRRFVEVYTLIRSGANSPKRAELIRKARIFHSFGKGCLWQPLAIPSDPQLVSIGNNVIVSANVRFITHDKIQTVLLGMNNPEYPVKARHYIGKIVVYDNVMIGSDSTILYDVSIGPNAVIAAGSVVTKDVPEDAIVGGNPARVIGSLKKLAEKRYANLDGRPHYVKNISEIEEYFWKDKE